MPNDITGAYDAVVEVRVGALNALLATVHQRGALQDVSPTVPHSFAVRIGDTPNVVMAVARLAQWTMDLVGRAGRRAQASPKPPPGVSRTYEQMQAEVRQMELESTAVAVAPVRGTAQVQFSTPTVTFAAGSSSEATVHAGIRVHYVPDPVTPPLPEPIHGELSVTYQLEVKASGGAKILEVTLSGNDGQVQFVPAAGTGLTTAQVAQIVTWIRPLIKYGFEPINEELSADSPFVRFKALGGGAGQVLALPLRLSNQPQPPSSALNALSNVFVGSHTHFAVAVSREYAESQLQLMMDSLTSFQQSVSLQIADIDVATYDISISSAALTWHTGSIELVLQGTAVTESIFPNYEFAVSQELALSLDVPSQQVSIHAVGDPSITGDLPGPAVQQARNIIKSESDDALLDAQSSLNQALTGSIGVNDTLHSFDPSAQGSLASIAVTPDGVILQGYVTASQRPGVVAAFTETAAGDAFSALKSWVPAGGIDRFVWSWVVGSPAFPWAQVSQVVVEEHRFVFPKPANLPPSGLVCLRVEGTQMISGAGVAEFHPEHGPAAVAGGSTCTPNGFGLRWVVPSNWVRVMTPIWGPDPPPELPLEEAITGHVDVLGHAGRVSGRGANAIVHFADASWADSLGAFVETFGQQARSRRDAAIILFVVLPRGSFAERRSAFERRLESLAGFSGSIVLTEDYESGWSRAFGLEREPATYLMNARGDFAWQQAGPVDRKSLTDALERHLVDGALRSHAIRMKVRPGDRAPDAMLSYPGGDRVALRKLRGRPVILNFWKSWSRPCLVELERLQRLHDQSGARPPTVVAICDGGSVEDLATIQQLRRLTIALVPDPEGAIGRRYGVSCWPTTMHVSRDGLVERVSFGAERAGARPAIDLARADDSGIG
jgi:peroxiredoxin